MTSTKGSAAAAVVLVVAVVAIGAGGYWLYKNDKLPFEIPFLEREKVLSPEESADLVDKIIDAQRAITSLHSKQMITISVDGIDPSVIPAIGSLGSGAGSLAAAFLAQETGDNKGAGASAEITIAAEGNAVLHDLKTPDSEVSFSVDAKLVEKGSEQKFLLSGDFKAIDRAIYLRVNEIPAQLALFIPQVNDFIGKWIAFDYSNMFNGNDALRAQFEEAQAKQQQEAERLLSVIKEEYRKHPFLTITKTVGTEAGEGEEAIRYRYALDKVQLRDFLIAAMGRFGEGQQNLNFTANPADIDRGLAAFSSFGGEMTVGEDTARIYSVTFVAALAVEDYGSASVSMESTQSRFGEEFKIAAPEDAIDIMELFGGALGSFGFGGSSVWDSDDDEDGLVLAAEQLLCTDPKLADTDGDGFNDRQEIDGGYHPLGAGPLQSMSQLRLICPLVAGVAADQGARDTQRVSDLANLQYALNLYLVTVRDPRLGCEPNTLYVSAPAKPPAGWRIGGKPGRASVDGTGWLPVDLRQVAGGSPLQALSIDPLNVGILGSVYAYACDPEANRYELNMRPEVDLDTALTDGGDDPRITEVGTYNTANLIPGEFWSQF